MTEELDEELRRLVDAYQEGERQYRQEAWNLIADFSIENAVTICTALRSFRKLHDEKGQAND